MKFNKKNADQIERPEKDENGIPYHGPTKCAYCGKRNASNARGFKGTLIAVCDTCDSNEY